jgi:uncharacterized protein (DUF58 family)
MMKRRRERIYIVPTQFGAVFLAGAFTMVLIGASYQNNLINLLAFFMLSLDLVAMIQTHQNLREVTVSQVECEGNFVNEPVIVTATLQNPTATDRFNLEISIRKKKPVLVFENQGVTPSRSSLRVRHAYTFNSRGLYRLRKMKVETIYPLGLFRAWQWFDVESDFYVYPKPVGELPLPRRAHLESILQKQTNKQHSRQGDDFRGHRLYQKGDSLGHVDWKAHARGRPLMIKEINDGHAEILTFDSNALIGMTRESVLGQLANWVREAQLRRLAFRMRLDDQTIAAGEGLQHSKKCLERLAVDGVDLKKVRRETA